jgi:hypothetical protein
VHHEWWLPPRHHHHVAAHVPGLHVAARLDEVIQQIDPVDDRGRPAVLGHIHESAEHYLSRGMGAKRLPGLAARPRHESRPKPVDLGADAQRIATGAWCPTFVDFLYESLLERRADYHPITRDRRFLLRTSEGMNERIPYPPQVAISTHNINQISSGRWRALDPGPGPSCRLPQPHNQWEQVGLLLEDRSHCRTP